MKSAFRKTGVGVAAAATAGASTLMFGAPAVAAPNCETGTLIAPGICEQVFTSSGEFIPTANMTKLEVLLVGAGGNGVAAPIDSAGYAAAGGGGEVKIVGFATATAPFTVTVPAPGAPGGVSDGGSNVATVLNGTDGSSTETPAGSATGGNSGNGNIGAFMLEGLDGYPPYAAGAGSLAPVPAGAPVNPNGGAGTVVSSIAPAGSLFASDTSCYGGGGAVGVPAIPGDPGRPAVQGFATCGGGQPTDATGLVVTAPAANSGGGAGSVGLAQESAALTTGASGRIVFRWAPVLPATGGGLNEIVITAGIAALFAGAALAIIANRRKRAEEA